MRFASSPLPFSLLACTLFTGCSATFNPTDAPVQTPIGALSGRAYGGQQPIVSAKIYLFAAGTAAYAGPGIAAATSNASTSLLNSTVPAVCTAALAPGGSLPCKDASGNYFVFTDANGTFSVTGDYTCTAGTQLYLYSAGGQPTTGVTNTAASLMAVLGNCPSGGSIAAQVPYVYMNEVTTVAAAYALAGFASDAIHISTSGTALGLVGIKNAFANAAQMSNIGASSGSTSSTTNAGGALATTPGGNGTVPQKLLNTLANILAGCVNSNGTTTACTMLFNDDRTGGGQTGTKPTETATAAIYLAQHPYTAYVSTIYNLIGSSAVPFTPALTAAPATFAVEILFSDASLSNAEGYSQINQNLAVDASGYIWVANGQTPSVSQFSPLGVALAGSTGFAPGGCNFSVPSAVVPVSIAVANNGYVWVGVTDENAVCVIDSTGTFVDYTLVSGTYANHEGPYGIALDSAGNAWVTNDYAYTRAGNTAAIGQLEEVSGSSYTITKSIFNTDSLDQPLGVAIASPATFGTGHTGDIWVANNSSYGYTTGPDCVFTAGGTAETFSPDSGGGSIGFGQPVAIDASGSIWTGLRFDSGSTRGLVKIPYTGTSGNLYSEGTGTTSLSIDGSGNVWSLTTLSTSSGAATTVFENSNTGSLLTPSAGFVPITDASGTVLPLSIVVDGSGNVWYTMAESSGTGNYGLRELVGIATPVATPIAYGVANNLLGSRP